MYLFLFALSSSTTVSRYLRNIALLFTAEFRRFCKTF